MQKFEYVAVDLPKHAGKGSRLDDLISQKLNDVAEHGWRLVTVSDAVAVFERVVGNRDD